MKILTISGSPHQYSANRSLLEAIAAVVPTHEFQHFDRLVELPLFATNITPTEAVTAWQAALQSSDALIISTPEYIHNMPAVLKNALEWVTSSGELVAKPVLAITFTPNEPRGERAMQSLLWSLTALDAKVVASLPLYQLEVKRAGEEMELPGEMQEMLREAVQLLVGKG